MKLLNLVKIEQAEHPVVTPTPDFTALSGRDIALPRAEISRERWEIIAFCARLTRLFGIPRSAGEIFGFVFSALTPVTFENVVAGLGISNGSASQGIRLLRQVGALKLTYVARDRRDFFVAETSAARLLAGFLNENVLHELADNRQRLCELRTRLETNSESEAAALLGRVELLLSWNRQGSTALKAALEQLA